MVSSHLAGKTSKGHCSHHNRFMYSICGLKPIAFRSFAFLFLKGNLLSVDESLHFLLGDSLDENKEFV